MKRTRQLTHFTSQRGASPISIAIFLLAWAFALLVSWSYTLYWALAPQVTWDKDFNARFGFFIACAVVFIPLLYLFYNPRSLFDNWYFPNEFSNTLFPVATEQPLALPESVDLAQSEYVGSINVAQEYFLRRTVLRWDRAIEGLVGALILLGVAVPSNIAFPSPYFVWLAGSWHMSPVRLVQIYDFTLVALLFLLVTPPLMNALREVTSRKVYATSAGLRWGRHLIPWKEIRGFYCRSYRNRGWDELLYRVDGPHDSLVWRVLLDEAQTDQLARLVYSFGMLPARDLTEFKKSLDEHGSDLRRLIAERRKTGEDVSTLETLTAQIYPPRALRGR